MTKLIATALLGFLEARGYEIAPYQAVNPSLSTDRRDQVLADIAAHLERQIRQAPAQVLRTPSLLELVCQASNVVQTAAHRAHDVVQRSRLTAIGQALAAEVRTAAGLTGPWTKSVAS